MVIGEERKWEIPTVHLIGPISNRFSALPMAFFFLLLFLVEICTAEVENGFIMWILECFPLDGVDRIHRVHRALHRHLASTEY